MEGGRTGDVGRWGVGESGVGWNCERGEQRVGNGGGRKEEVYSVLWVQVVMEKEKVVVVVLQ